MLKVDGELRGPELPESIQWPDATRAWWNTWRASPLAQTFKATDWDFLLDTALLHGQFWSGDLSVAGELRLRVAKFGATPEDRARLKLQIEEPAAPEAAPKPAARRSAAARKSRILSVVDGSTA